MPIELWVESEITTILFQQAFVAHVIELGLRHQWPRGVVCSFMHPYMLHQGSYVPVYLSDFNEIKESFRVWPCIGRIAQRVISRDHIQRGLSVCLKVSVWLYSAYIAWNPLIALFCKT